MFRALYLDALTSGELSMRLAPLVGLSPDQVSDVFMEGPAGIRLLVTDDVVQHMKNEGLFIVEICQGKDSIFKCVKIKRKYCLNF